MSCSHHTHRSTRVTIYRSQGYGLGCRNLSHKGNIRYGEKDLYSSLNFLRKSLHESYRTIFFVYVTLHDVLEYIGKRFSKGFLVSIWRGSPNEVKITVILQRVSASLHIETRQPTQLTDLGLIGRYWKSLQAKEEHEEIKFKQRWATSFLGERNLIFLSL